MAALALNWKKTSEEEMIKKYVKKYFSIHWKPQSDAYILDSLAKNLDSTLINLLQGSFCDYKRSLSRQMDSRRPFIAEVYQLFISSYIGMPTSKYT